MAILKILVIIGIIITVGIMLAGIFTMGKGGSKNSNKMMRYRVISQAVTLVLILLFLYLNG